jgi:uncharacterized membrane protein
MMFATGAILVLVDIVTNLSPPEVAIPLLAVVGIVFGVAVSNQIGGALVGLVTGAIVAALAESAQTTISMQAISGPGAFLVGHVFLWIGLLLFAASFAPHVTA